MYSTVPPPGKDSSLIKGERANGKKDPPKGISQENWEVSYFLFCQNQKFRVEYTFSRFLSPYVGRFQPTSRDTINNREMYDFWWTNKRSFVFVHQHGCDDVT